MYTSLYSSHDQIHHQIYSFAELDFPLEGVEFTDSSNNLALRPYIAFNMVSSVDGKATTSDGKLVGLGSRPDRLLMKRLRSQFDAVLVGAATFRQDAIIPTLPPDLVKERQKNFEQPQPLGIVISNSGEFSSEHRFWEGGRNLRLVLIGENTPIPSWLESKAQVLRFPVQSEQIDLKKVLPILFENFNIQRLLVEGGATLNYEFIAQGLADELFLTLSPHIVGGIENLNIVGGAGYGLGGDNLTKLKLRSLYHHESELFLRYHFQSANYNKS
jgi:riboflavin-specific deaminase-like protein